MCGIGPKGAGEAWALSPAFSARYLHLFLPAGSDALPRGRADEKPSRHTKPVVRAETQAEGSTMSALPARPSCAEALRILDGCDGDSLVFSAHRLLVTHELRKAAPAAVAEVIDVIDDLLVVEGNKNWVTSWGYFAQVAIEIDAVDVGSISLVLDHYMLVIAGLCTPLPPRQVAVQLIWLKGHMPPGGDDHEIAGHQANGEHRGQSDNRIR